MGSHCVCWTTVDRWTADLIGESYKEIQSTFIAAGVSPPRMLWRPAEAELPAQPMRTVHRYWSGLGAEGSPPHHARIDPLGFVPALGYVNILETVAGSGDLRYRLFGSIAASISGFDMTGRMLSAHPASPYVRDFSLAAARACLGRGEPLFTEREPAGAERTYRWPRLILPLAGDCGRPVRLLSVIVPLDSGRNVIR